MAKVWEWIKAIAIAVALALVIRTFLFAPIVVDGISMMPTLHDRDRMIVNKFKYKIWVPKRLDIIVFKATEDKDYIKRIIGLPGDHIEYKNDVLFINGKAQEEPYLDKYKKELPKGELLTADFSMEQIPGGYKVIPEGYLLVLGDNRRNSKDSRMIGLVPESTVIGKANIMYWPLKQIGFVE